MNVIKLKFSLKQVTPMIHFQDDDEATIRATELKPKLDRFILSWLAYEKEEKKWTKQKIDSEAKMLKQTVKDLKDKAWLVDQDQVHQYHALNYKMRIKAENKVNRDFRYGNAVYILNKDKYKYKSSFYSKIIIDITCFNQELANRIKELLPILIDLTAFGLQQSKGYGNFRVSKINNQDYKDNIENNLLKAINHFKSENILVYKLELDKEKNDKINTDYAVALNAIAEYNRFLKSGLRQNNEYIPSVIMKKYFKQNRYNIINEKKAMKQKLELSGYNINNLKHKDNGKLIDDCDFKKPLNDNKIYYTRGLLGFAQLYQFSLCIEKNRDKFDIIPRDKNGKEKKAFLKDFDVKGKIGKEEISRFPSPLHYHVSENYKEIYIIINNNALISLQNANPKIVFNERYNKDEKKRKKERKIQFTAQLPDTEKFDFESFFEIAGLNKVLYMLDVKNKSGINYDGEYFLTKLEEDQNER